MSLQGNSSRALTTQLFTVDTNYSADSVEFCPIAGYECLLASGTYQLLEAKEPSSDEGNDGNKVRLLRKMYDDGRVSLVITR